MLRDLGAQLKPVRSGQDVCAESLLKTFGTLQVLCLDGAAVGLCGIEDPVHGTPAETPPAIEFRMVVGVIEGLDASDAAEAADRLIGELARCVAAPLSIAEVRTAASTHRRGVLTRRALKAGPVRVTRLPIGVVRPADTRVARPPCGRREEERKPWRDRRTE